MAVESIQNTVQNALPREARQYDRYVRPVIQALSDREASVKRELAAFATQRGLSQAEVDGLFRQVGLEGDGGPLAGCTQAGELQAIRRIMEDVNTRLNNLDRR